MSVTKQKIDKFVSGTHNKLPNEEIPQDASSDSLNWVNVDGKIQLILGRQTIGGAGLAGKNYGEHTAYQVDGTPLRFRKINGKIQYKYLADTTWTDVIIDLTIDADYMFSNYQSNAGASLYIFGIDGIYKIMLANPGSYTALYDSTKNYKGYGFVIKSSTFMWGVKQNEADLHRSYIDEQIYTTVATEVLAASDNGVLAFKAGGPTRTSFGVVFTKGAVTYTDNNNGVLTASTGPNGTINYTTGDWTTPTNMSSGTADYSWEDSNNHGVTDFSESGTRLAGEGLIIPQKNKIITVIPLDGSYFSIQQSSCYRLSIDSDDLGYDNQEFRTDIGVQSLRSAVGTSLGIIFINTANESKPVLQKLSKNVLGDNFDVTPLFSWFAFENFTYDDALLETWDDYILIGCKKNSGENNRLLLCNILRKTVNETYYGIRTSTKINDVVNGGDPVSQSTYELFTGFDDNGTIIDNNWDSKGETYGDDVLKKLRKLRFKGLIDPGQRIAVYVAPDDGDFQLIGTILGSGDYVDNTASFAIGTVGIGTMVVGGENTVSVYGFLIEIKLKKFVKFRKRRIRFVALGYGFAALEQVIDFDIWTFEDKLPSSYRQKENVSLSGETNQP